MEKRLYPELSEAVYWDKLQNGLALAVVPRPGFSKKLAYFVTDYGAIHMEYTLKGEKKQAPAGVAHYLEHKLFDMPGRDITAEFAALGGCPNAFTGYDMTAYYFSCTENFEACLDLLLEFVSTPYFTAESVEKEQGIIGQEIDMNEDAPENRIFENLMQAMYPNHPVNQPILGTRESISRITPEVLSQCHQAFYDPSNMLLCVVGDVDPETVRTIAEKRLGTQMGEPAQAVRNWQEEMTCPDHQVTMEMEVAMPMFHLGFKAEPLQRGEAAVRQEIIGDLAAEALFGESSELYLSMYEQGLVDSSFGGGYETIEGMSLLCASGDSEDPQAVADAIVEYAAAICRKGIGQEQFLRMKRSAMGRRLRGLDSFDSTCFRVCAYYFSGFDYFCFPKIYRDVQESEIIEFIQRVVTRERSCLSVINPFAQEDMQ